MQLLKRVKAIELLKTSLMQVGYVEESKTFDDETKTIYVYDTYILTVNDRNGLEDTVKENLEQWLSYAKNNVDEKPLSASEQIEQLKSTVNSQAQIIDEVVFNILPELLNK